MSTEQIHLIWHASAEKLILTYNAGPSVHMYFRTRDAIKHILYEYIGYTVVE